MPVFKFRDKNMKYIKGYKCQLSGDVFVHIPTLKPYIGISTKYLAVLPGSILLLRRGYAWDGASGPTWDSKSSMRGSLVHDALYQLMRHDLISRDFRKVADKLFYEICIQDGMWRWRAKVWLWALRKFAGSLVLPGSRKQEQYAP